MIGRHMKPLLNFANYAQGGASGERQTVLDVVLLPAIRIDREPFTSLDSYRWLVHRPVSDP
jgi:hypothetical protein